MKRSAKTQPQTEAAKLVKITVYDFECAKTLAGDPLQSLLSRRWARYLDTRNYAAFLRRLE